MLDAEMRRNSNGLFRRDCILLLFALDVEKAIRVVLRDKLFMTQLGELEQTAVLNVVKH